MTLRWWWLLLVIPLALVACGGGEKTQTPEPSATAVVAQPSATAHVSVPRFDDPRPAAKPNAVSHAATHC